MPLLATFGLEITTSRRRCTRYTNSCCCSSCMTTPLLPGTRAVQSRECSLPCATFFLKNLKESSDVGCPRHHAQTAQLHDVHLQDDVQAHAPPSSDRSSRISITSNWIEILAIFHLPKILATRNVVRVTTRPHNWTTCSCRMSCTRKPRGSVQCDPQEPQ